MKKIYKFLSIFIAVIITLPSITAFAIISNVVDYNDYIIDIKTDGTHDTVTIEIPTDKALHKLSCELTGDYFESKGSEVEILEGDLGEFSFDNTFSDTIQLLGGNTYFTAENIPAGTIITADITVKHYDSDHIIANNDTWESYLYAVARSSNNSALAGNKSDNIDLMNDEMRTISTVFNKPTGTIYFDPMVKVTIYNPYSERSYIKIDNVRMSFSISSLLRLQQQTGKTNELLTLISQGTLEQNQQADDFRDKTNEKLQDAENVQQELDNVNKIDAQALVGQVNTYDIVSEGDITSYTDMFKSILDSEIVFSMLMICVSLALVSLVLFGKKG